MQPETIHGEQATRRDSLKRLCAGVIGLSSLASHGHSNASSGFSAQGLKRIAPSMKFQIDQGIFTGVVSLVAYKGNTIHIAFLSKRANKAHAKQVLSSAKECA